MAEPLTRAHFDVVILGAGYAGLMAALGLSGRNPLQRIALISERGTFIERIRLQESISAPVADRLEPLAGFLAGSKVSFVQGRVEALDAANHCVSVRCDGTLREIHFDRCVYALGSRSDVASIPGVAQHAYRLDPGDEPHAVNALRTRLESIVAGNPRVVIIGGGNTAAEVAGEIKSTWLRADVTMISRSRIGDFDKGSRLETVMRAELQRAGVRMIDGQAVTEVMADRVVTAAGDNLPADICIAAAGLRTPSIARLAGLAVDHQDRVWADARLSSTTHPDILAVGDALHPTAPCGARYRMSAFAAIISGAYAAKRIIREARGLSARPFSYAAYGQGLAIGKRGVGFLSYPDDRTASFIVSGPPALAIRNLFVAALLFFLKLERRFPGSAVFWIGRRRVSWRTVNSNRPDPSSMRTSQPQGPHSSAYPEPPVGQGGPGRSSS